MGVKLFSIFLMVLIVDGIILPAFFGFRESLLSLLILVMPALYFGVVKRYLVYGLFFSVALEFFKGLEFGSLAAPFLFTAAVIYLMQRFLDVKHTHDGGFSLARLTLTVAVAAGFGYMFLFFYGLGNIHSGYFNAAIGLTEILEALILVLVFNAVFDKKSDYL